MDSVIRVLIFSQDEGSNSFIQDLLKNDSEIVCTVMKNIDQDDHFINKLINFFQDSETDVIILCDCFQQISILELIKIFKQRDIPIPIIVVSKRDETTFAVEVVKAGAENFLVRKYLDSSKFIDAVYSALQTREKQRQLEKIRLENQKLLQAIEQSPVSIIITKAETNKIEYSNPMFTQLTGYGFDEIKGKSPSILKTGFKKTEDYEEMWKTVLSGKTWQGEFINRKKDGNLFFASSVISPITINDLETTHFIGIHQDITGQKEAELKLKNYANMLEKKSNELEKAYDAIEKNIQKAKRLHRHFFPLVFPEIEGIEIEAFYEPAQNIGSDYYNFIHLKDQLIVYVVDVSGSGIDGAFINIFIRQKINRYLYVEMLDHDIVSPKELLNFIAKHFVKEQFPEEYFICLYVAVLDLNSNCLTYSNAGIQVPPMLVNKGRLKALDIGGLPISSAIDMELLSYEEETTYLDEASTFIISTDGIVESVVNGDIYGIERFQQLVLDYYFLPPKELKSVINTDLIDILQKHKSHDDITYVIVQTSFNVVEEKQFIIKSDCHIVENIVEEITSWLETYTKEVNCLLVGFNEMIYNAIEHGNKFDLSKNIIINIEVNQVYALIIIEDEGEGFNWRPRINKELNFLNFEERGRGIIFTKASFDYFNYNEKGNKVYLYKKIQPLES